MEQFLAFDRVGQLLAALAPAERFDGLAVAGRLLDFAAALRHIPVLVGVFLLVAGLEASRGAQLVPPGGQLHGGQLRQLGTQRLVMGGGLGAIALDRFANVGDGVSLRPAGCVLASLALDRRRRVEVGLLASARGGDVGLLLVHARVNHHVGGVHGRALGAVGRHSVGVLQGGSLAAQGGAVQVVAADLHTAGLVDALKDDPPALGVHLGDLPALAVVDAAGAVVDAGDDLIAGSEGDAADLDLLGAQTPFGLDQLARRRVQALDLNVSLRDHQCVVPLGVGAPPILDYRHAALLGGT